MDFLKSYLLAFIPIFVAFDVLGLLPMALGFSMGAEMRAPMARAIVGGLSTSTLITLVLIPSLYWIIESKSRKST